MNQFVILFRFRARWTNILAGHLPWFFHTICNNGLNIEWNVFWRKTISRKRQV
jgi:hypothetical protein